MLPVPDQWQYNFSGLCSNQQLFSYLLDRASNFPLFNTKIIYMVENFLLHKFIMDYDIFIWFAIYSRYLRHDDKLNVVPNGIWQSIRNYSGQIILHLYWSWIRGNRSCSSSRWKKFCYDQSNRPNSRNSIFFSTFLGGHLFNEKYPGPEFL